MLSNRDWRRETEGTKWAKCINAPLGLTIGTMGVIFTFFGGLLLNVMPFSDVFAMIFLCLVVSLVSGVVGVIAGMNEARDRIGRMLRERKILEDPRPEDKDMYVL